MKKYIGYSLIAAVFTACSGNPQQEKAIALEAWKPVFQEVEVPADTGSFFPRLAEGENELLMSWYTKGEGEITELHVATHSEEWSEPEQVAAGENWFVNWADFPNLASYTGDYKAISYLQKKGEGIYSYEVHLKFYDPATGEWSEKSMVPHTDNTETEHGFVSMAAMKEGNLGLLWLDGRKYAEAAHAGHDSHGGKEEMTLRFAKISPSGEVVEQTSLDGRTCDCCQTGMAATENGLLAVYRDRSIEEIRDIAFVRYENGEWSKPEIVHPDGWEIKGCPVNGPSIDAAGQEVAVGWFTGAENQNKVKLIRSHDGGRSWEEPLLIDGDRPVGRVDVRILPDSSALLSWLAAENQIKVRRISREGKDLGSAVVATVEGGRSLGFPQLAYKEGAVYLAWTDTNKPKKIKMVKASL